MPEDIFLLLIALGIMLFVAGAMTRLADWWYERAVKREETSWKIKRPLRVLKITKKNPPKEPPTARVAGTVYPDREGVNEK